MRRSVRLILLNMDLEDARELRNQLLSVEGLKIIAEIDDPAMLMQAVQQFRCDLVVLQLDPQPEMVLAVAENIMGSNAHLPMVAISQNCDGTLVLKAMRAGLREYLQRPPDLERLEEVLDKIASAKDQSANQGQLITVVGSAGGVGATLLAANLAVELADLQAKAGRPDSVVLADLDFRFGQIATCLDLQPGFTLADLCETHEQLDRQIIDKAAIKHDTGLHVLARPHTLEQADMITAAHTAAVVGALQDIYDFVVVDGPYRFDPSARPVFDLADINYLIIQLLVPSIRNAQRILEAMRAGGYNVDRVSLVCNRYTKAGSQLTLEHAEATLGRDLAMVVPEDWKACSTVLNLGEPLCLSNAKKPVRMAIRELAEKTRDPQGYAERHKDNPKMSGLLGRMGIFSNSPASS